MLVTSISIEPRFLYIKVKIARPMATSAAATVMTVAAAEVAIGLAILTLMYRNRGSIDIDVTNTLKG